MKPIYLEFCGINSFSEPAKIDFTKLIEYGLFGIFGDTGSGKSTILDCIVFALYGKISRAGKLSEIINYRLDKAYVYFEFEIVYEGERCVFRVEREIKQRSTTDHSAVLYERKDGKLITVANSTKTCKDMLEKIIGLGLDDFERCIALPQGEFAQFVKAQQAERLRLIARLFDLERYGSSLYTRANSRATKAAANVKVLEARLEPYASVSEENNARLAAEIDTRKREEIAVGSQLTEAQNEEKRIVALLEQKRESERARARLAMLEAKRGEMDILKEELSRLDRAAAVVASMKDGATLRERSKRAEAEKTSALDRFKRAEDALTAFGSWNEEALDAEIERLTALRVTAATAEDIRSRRQRAEKRLADATRELERESASYTDFSYSESRIALEAELAALGEGDFLRFAEEHGKAALLRGEYAAFAEEIDVLIEKYPEITADATPLSKKYRALAQGETTDFATLRGAFEAREASRRKVQQQLLALESEKGKYELHVQRMQQLREETVRLREEIAECESLLIDAPTLAETDRALEEKKREKREKSERMRRLTEELAGAKVSFAAAEERASAAALALEEGKQRYRDALAAGGFENATEAESLIAKFGDAAEAKSRHETYRADYAAALAMCEKFPPVEDAQATDERLAAVQASVAEKAEALRECARRIALAEDELIRGEKLLAEKKTLTKEHAEAYKVSKIFEQLKKLLDNNKFMDFVAAEYLQTVAVNASSRLLSLTDGRYFLRYDNGFIVGDNFNGGKTRGVNTLSGGETFLVSLSLALALGVEICARSMRPIEFFFLDEGFGTLDEKLVDTVMDSLEKLRSEHFTIGLISHVEELKHRIGRKISVKKATEQHGSQIEIE